MPVRSQSNPPCTAHLTAKKHRNTNRLTASFIPAAIDEESEQDEVSDKILLIPSQFVNDAGRQINRSSKERTPIKP